MKLQTAVFLAPALSSTFAHPPNQTWNYIIVGSGASGIPLADRLSESGASVLLLERGCASSSRWGGTWKPSWLEGTNLTRFDVPALAQYIWTDAVDNEGILCDDVQNLTAGCVLGGGTAVNAGQFYLPTPEDFDLNQPPGFRWADMTNAFQKAKDRLPWTERPSLDGKSYLTNGTQIALDALTNTSLPNPYRLIHANDERDDRQRVTSFAEFFFLNGEKGGPMATYLVSASARKNFHLQLNTTVTRVLRHGDIAMGVEIEATSPGGGLTGTINVKPGTGKVILSAGVFNTFKILLRSGIGPADQLALLANHSTEAEKIPPKDDWIDRPVGRNLDDSPSVSCWIREYLESRRGPLAEIQPSLGPISWEKIKGEDGRTRTVQWDVNSSGGMGLVEGGLLLFASNLNLGKTSRGSLSLKPDSRLSVSVSTMPYFNDDGDHDFKAVLTSATSLLEILNTIPDSSVLFPPAGTPLQDYLRSSIFGQEILTRNHWVSSTRMGASCSDAEAVGDSTTVVCGMKNLHVMDAGIVNGVPTANPQAMFIVVVERAAEVILGLG